MRIYLIKWTPRGGGSGYFLSGITERFVDMKDADVYLSEADAKAMFFRPEDGEYDLVELEV